MGKTNDFNTAKTIYLYHVDLGKAAHELYLQTCKVNSFICELNLKYLLMVNKKTNISENLICYLK